MIQEKSLDYFIFIWNDRSGIKVFLEIRKIIANSRSSYCFRQSKFATRYNANDVQPSQRR